MRKKGEPLSDYDIICALADSEELPKSQEKTDMLIGLIANSHIYVKDNNLIISLDAINGMKQSGRYDYFMEILDGLIANIPDREKKI